MDQSLFFRLVFASRASSNHHRLALEALNLLTGPTADAWRTAFLVHHERYLKGAKAPDTQFKDFQNHVLHVGEGEWGGAIRTAQAWYARTLSLFQAQDWANAIASAGVLSHYIVDPMQPLHTAQSEAENALHAAVERSFSKSYPMLRARLLAEHGGFPRLAAPAGEDWLAGLIREGAHAAHAHYETVIDHYDVLAGAEDPLRGLDETLTSAIAELVGRAAASVALVLDRLFAEAAVAPPTLNPTPAMIFAAIEAPAHKLLDAIEDLGERALVRAQIEEYLATGKTIATLTEDDRTIRARHCEDVLKIPLAELDAQPLPPLGTRHGQPAKATSAPSQGRRLKPEDPIVDAPAIGPKTAARFEAIGVRTVGEFLAEAPATLAQRLAAKHLPASEIEAFQAMARLACALPNVRALDAKLLVEAGVRAPGDLAGQDAQGLQRALSEAFGRLDAHSVRNAAAPNAARIAGWLSAA